MELDHIILKNWKLGKQYLIFTRDRRKKELAMRSPLEAVAISYGTRLIILEVIYEICE